MAGRWLVDDSVPGKGSGGNSHMEKDGMALRDRYGRVVVILLRRLPRGVRLTWQSGVVYVDGAAFTSIITAIWATYDG